MMRGHPNRIGPALRTVVVGLVIAAACAGCGDPVLILGDQPAVFRIVVGIPGSSGTTVDSLGTASELTGPQGLAASGDGTVYIADRRGRIVAADARGRFHVLVDHGNCTSAACVLGQPHGIALDQSGGLLVADERNHRIWRLDLQTRTLTPVAGTGTVGLSPDGTPALEARLGQPTGVVVAPDGRIIFSERSNHRVLAIQPDGTITTLAGTGSPGFSGDGGPAADARMTGPAGLAIAGSILYIAEGGGHRVRRVDLTSGIIQTVAGTGSMDFGGDGGPATQARLRNPLAVAVSHDGRVLYVADTGNRRVRAVSLANGVITTFAGTGEAEFNGDLLEAGATALGAPSALAVSPLGQFYVADAEQHVVRRTTLGF
ncbi:MAG TPA: hypothetical protein VKZ58_13510 [Longimicrobiales bacterium]|nr:hypothetical protein [Longimicrobiales bacterium]